MKTNLIELPKGQGKKIRVTFPDGTVIEKSVAWETLAEVIKRVGVEKVANLNIPGIERKGIMLLDTKLADEEGYRKSQKDMGGGYYLLTKTSTDKKISDLTTISIRLNLNLLVEICAPNDSFITKKCGIVFKEGGKWLFHPSDFDSDDIRAIPFTDHWTVDTIILRHQSRYGIFSLPNLGNYGNDGSLKWECMTDEPFPYDKILVIGAESVGFTLIAYKIGKKWGINYMMYTPSDDRVFLCPMIPCEYKSLAEAEKHLLTWYNPYKEIITV